MTRQSGDHAVEEFAMWPNTVELCDMKGDDEVDECIAMSIRPFCGAAVSLNLQYD